jgi:hypothetical protein
LQVEELRADVHVQARHVEAGVAGAADRLERGVLRQPELRAVVRRPDRLVRVGLDPGRDAHEHPSHSGRGCALDLLQRVEYDESGTCLRGGSQLVVALVVAVHHDPLGRDAGPERELELAEAGHIRAEPLVGKQAQQRGVREGLGPVGDERARRGAAVRGRLLAQRGLAVDEERRPVLVRQLGGADAAERELASGDRGARREEVEHGLILSATIRSWRAVAFCFRCRSGSCAPWPPSSEAPCTRRRSSSCRGSSAVRGCTRRRRRTCCG